jgi:diguanylate cyclase (GGDEF)-like protein/PAS domain S-box-containing protein
LLPEAIYVHRQGNFLFSNKAGTVLFGAKNNEELFKHNWKEFIYYDTGNVEHFLKEELTNAKKQVLSYQIKANRLDGKVIDIEITSTNVEFNGLSAREIIARDISFQKQQEGMVKKLAYQDTLNELPNRRAFMENLEQQLTYSEKFVVMFIDLDGFKNVNDTFGHKAGDDLLKKVSIQLKKCVQEKDMVARLAGDEFTILLPDANQHDCMVIASKIIESLNMSLFFPVKAVRVTASIGISLYPQNGEDAFTLLKHADMAMYHAKNKGKNRYEFTNLITAV